MTGSHTESIPEPALLLAEYAYLFAHPVPSRPVLDLACGDGRNGIFLAERGIPVLCCDISSDNLMRVRENAEKRKVTIQVRQLDMEAPGANPFTHEVYGGIIVFRYLHRPLVPCLRKALAPGGILIYETYTVKQPEIGRPHNPDFLLKPGELAQWFKDWEVIHSFEGIQENPRRAIAQIVCRKPFLK